MEIQLGFWSIQLILAAAILVPSFWGIRGWLIGTILEIALFVWLFKIGFLLIVLEFLIVPVFIGIGYLLARSRQAAIS